MLDNIKSKRTDYLSFSYDNVIKEHLYYYQLQKPIKTNTLLLITRSKKYSFEKVRKIVKALKGKNIQIFVKEYFKKEFENVSYVTVVESSTKEYYDAMATSEYIYTDTFLFPDFVNRQGQIVFNDIDMSVNTINDRVNLCVSSKKSHYFIKNKSNKSDITFRKFVRYLSKKKFSPRAVADHSNGKTSILYIINLKYFDLLFSYIKNISKWIDYEKYDVTVLYDNYYEERYCSELMTLDARINIAAKKGRVLCSCEDYRKLVFLKNEILYINNKNDIDEFLSDNLFSVEANRVLGKCNYDIVVNLAYDSFYWNWLAKTISTNCAFFDLTNYADMSEESASGRLSFLDFYNKLIFLNEKNLNSARLFDEKIKDKAQLFSYVPVRDEKYNKLKIVEVNNQSYYVINESVKKNLDAFGVRLIKVFSDSMDYTVLNNNLSASQAQAFIKKLSKKCRCLVVFDFFNIIRNSDIADFKCNNVVIYRSPFIYSMLINKLNKCYFCNQVFDAAALEALDCGKQIFVYDIDSDSVNEVNTSDYRFEI